MKDYYCSTEDYLIDRGISFCGNDDINIFKLNLKFLIS